MNLNEDPKSNNLAWVGAIGGLILLLSIMLLQVLFYRMQASEVAAKSSNEGAEAMTLLAAEQRARIEDGYRWTNRELKHTGIPIADAMARIVAAQEREGR